MSKKLPIAMLAGAGVAAGLIFYKSITRVSIPKGAKAVEGFDADRYLGQWYEIARLDYKYERHLNNVTAHYSLEADGTTIRVDNKGYDPLKNKWQESVGKAKFVGDPQVGRLKVSFFGPFYAGYNVLAVDDDYQYALVAGNNLNYLWILSRTTTIPSTVKADYLAKAQALGYDTDALIWCEHDAIVDGQPVLA
jgi:apolipoprotein D and lipocalin family protein